jgi:hypothetical protein
VEAINFDPLLSLSMDLGMRTHFFSIQNECLQVRGVINMCDEYGGPIKKYEQLGMQQLRLRTVDHFEPSVNDLKVRNNQLRCHGILL